MSHLIAALPLDQPDYFGVANMVRVRDLFDAKVHLGHKEGTLHPSMRQYMLGSRLGHTIIDLDITAAMLRRALQVCHLFPCKEL